MMDEEEIDPAAEAFARLEGEIAMMRRAVRDLATEKGAIEIPDYSSTLGEIAQHLQSATETLDMLASKPAMELTPETMAQRLERAARQARESDQELITTARRRYDDAIGELRGLVASTRHATDQREYLIWAASGGVIAGCLLWAILPGSIARALPESWHMPEKIAARVLREPTIWEGGVRLLRVGSPAAWRAISDAAVMRHDNKEKIAACEKRASKAKRSIRCTINVKPPASTKR
ncbi:DUF6118 family protein [Sphingopyxis sp. SE2]|uniref:DUF6118 family protein n=1 Tax=Sphingopyxis sp. SE2 TaxID=1586240 RepID=UPI0028C0028E|nr:DUF6118 family protein [Sphingopyxis sp. SE2]MDT7530349.1 DUF6118 family protein [Sphingopyxis sp. SE2]